MKNVLALVLGVTVSAAVSAGSVTDEVNCFLGTEGTGHAFPAAAYPFGLVQAGPDTGWGTWEYCSGYQYRDKRITMFSQTHNSGGGCSDYADIGIMPVTGKVPVPVQIAATEKGKASTTSVAREYDKARERAEPGYYAVTLADGIRVESTASELCAVYRITYPKGVTPRLLVDLDYGMEGNPLIGYGARKRTATKESAWREGELLAHIVKNGFVPDRHIGVAMRFEPKPSAVEELPRQEGKHAPQYVADFDLSDDRTLVVRIGLSTTSVAGAVRNLERQVASRGFDDVRRAASEKWEKVLSRIRLEGGDRETRVNFATAVYRMFLQPQNVADADAAEPYYSEFSLWDTFRGAHPIYTLAAKEYVPKFVNSLVAHQERFGYLPVLPKWGRDTQCMIGTHAVSVIAEAYFKGFKDVDWERAYRAVKNTLTEPHKGRIKENWDLYDRYGYYPFDRIRGESVSRTLECSYDDWCAMRLAEALGHDEDAAFFRRRANCWTNVFDRSIGFVRGKDTQGRWREPFDPYRLGHGADTSNDFTEGNAFQYTWHVLQDPVGLMDIMGGRQAFVRKLDELFAAKDKVEGSGCVVDVTGLIGQYAHGNEPSHHIAYLYQYAGRGDRTAEKVREICRKFYRNAPDGLCGNEDHGEMSAWYVFACMGFYPVSPASGEYVLGAPQVPSVSVDVGGGKVFRVVSRGLSEQAKYVKSVSLNGRPLDGFILRHADIENGGELVFEMTDRPAIPTLDLSGGRQHMFQLQSGRVPVSISKDGQLVVEAWMIDEKQGLGDRLVLLADGKEFASGRVVKRTKTVSDYRIEATVPRTDAVLEIRIEDDDGKGVDAWATTGEFRVRGLSPIRFATPFGDGMVLQRDRKVQVWGTADAGTEVEVSFAGQVKTAVADQVGRWRVGLDPMPASKTGRPLTVRSLNPRQPNSQTISDVLVGEVWIVSGQSNCELPLVGKHPHFSDREGIMTANMTHRPFIRFAYASTYRYSLEPRSELRERAVWKEFNPKNLREQPNFSAMGVYFALAVESEIQVPIGLIGVYWGGTRIEPWIPIETLTGVRGSEWCLAEKPVVDSQWRKEMFGGRLEWPNSQPAVLWNDMIAPWCPMAVRGVLWYQGCSNARAGQFEMNDNYRLLMHALYDSWSKRFRQPDLKLYFVQIAPWPWNHWDVQLAQAKFAEEEPNAAMVTTCDIGNLSDIHPNEKGTVGRRLALLALRHDYGFTDLIADAPVLETCVADGDKVKMTFRDASAFWLYHRDWSVDVPFELAGADGKWTKAHLVNTVNGCTNAAPWKSKGAIDGGRTLIVAAPGVGRPVRVRYLREKAGEGFLYSVDSGLPVGPFESAVKAENGL